MGKKTAQQGVIISSVCLFGLLAFLLLPPHQAEAKSSVQEFERIITTPSSDGGPQVRVMDEKGEEITSFFAYASSFRSGYRLEVGDVNGDGEEEIVVAAGAGLAPLVRIFTVGGNYLGEFSAYPDNFSGGVDTAVGDVDGDGTDDIITSPLSIGGPNIRTFSYNGESYVPLAANFFAYDKEFTGGVNIALGDIDGDGKPELLTATNSGAPHVMVYGMRAGEFKQVTPGFMAYTPNFRGGVNIATGDLDKDGLDEIITSPASRAVAHVRIWGIRDKKVEPLTPGFQALEAYKNGAAVSAGDVNLDGKDEIIVGASAGQQPLVEIFDNSGTQLYDSFNAYSQTFTGGVNVATARIILRTTDKLIYAQGDGTDSNANAILKQDNSLAYELQTQFKLLDRVTTSAYTKFHTSYFGVYLRFQDINNWMRVDFLESYRPLDTYWVRLLEREAGRYTSQMVAVNGLDIASLYTEWHDLQIGDTGSLVSVTLDGAKILEKSYLTTTKVGYKGYLTNIATRAQFTDFSITASSAGTGTSAVDIGATSPYRYGGDGSWSSYRNTSRYMPASNPYFSLASDSNYSLPASWVRGSGLWIVVNDDRETEIIDDEAPPPPQSSLNKLIYVQGDGTDNNLNAAFFPDRSTDYKLVAKVKLYDLIDTDAYTRFHSSYFGAYLRYVDPLNWLRVDFLTAYRPAGTVYVRLLGRSGGNFISIKALPLYGYDYHSFFNSWHDLVIFDTGSNVEVKLDNVSVLTSAYASTVATGVKGYFSNIATRSVWEDIVVVPYAYGEALENFSFDTASLYKYGLDVSSDRYSTLERYLVSSNPLYSLRNYSSYDLPKKVTSGDGFWIYKEASSFQ